MEVILGIGGFFHDFNAGLITVDDREQVMVCAAEEERYSRNKHHKIMGAEQSSIACIEKCLDDAELRPQDVTQLVFSDLEKHPLKAFLTGLFPQAQVTDVHHHLCHAAAAFHSSAADDAAILCLDGFGDDKSGLLAHGRGNKIEALDYLDIADSIGLEFLRVTYQIGLGSFGAEGKTQGLAAYGEPRFYDDYMNEITLHDSGLISLSERLRNMAGYLEGEHYIEDKSLFNDFIPQRISRRFEGEPLLQEHMDMAASIQEVLNAVALHCAAKLQQRTHSPNLVLTGGVALNSTMNGILLNCGLYEKVYAHPSASDRGNGLGAALYFLTHKLGVNSPLDEPIIYGGNGFEHDAIEAALRQLGVDYRPVDDPASEAASLIAQNKIVGWFQGRSELGARALGNRSILASPGHAENKDILNARVKHREYFRPFAPSILSEYAPEYFVMDADGDEHYQPLSHMTMTVDVAASKRSEIPAVTHVDGTARIQSMKRENNPDYYQLIEHVHRLTGTPVVINTSFNDNNEPIVESPEDAVRCFHNTGMDALILGKYLLSKPGND